MIKKILLKEGGMAMKRVLFTVICFIFVFFMGMSSAVHADQSAEDAAVASAEKWLALVDEGKYAESWDESAEYLKNVLPKETWVDSLQAYRKPLGKLVSRKLKSKQYATSLPGAPDGEYVVIQYETSFENKKSAIETVTPMLDKDGTWMVSGYYIN
jgi:hypothetical protein